MNSLWRCMCVCVSVWSYWESCRCRRGTSAQRSASNSLSIDRDVTAMSMQHRPPAGDVTPAIAELPNNLPPPPLTIILLPVYRQPEAVRLAKKRTSRDWNYLRYARREHTVTARRWDRPRVRKNCRPSTRDWISSVWKKVLRRHQSLRQCHRLHQELLRHSSAAIVRRRTFSSCPLDSCSFSRRSERCRTFRLLFTKDVLVPWYSPSCTVWHWSPVFWDRWSYLVSVHGGP